jgi:uncharacterized membrane protein YeaQ/YmgE (transglycosylase-associated protein family)
MPKECSMLPFQILSKKNRSDEEVDAWERKQAKLGQDYDSPWLTALVTFSAFVAAFIGSVDVLFVIANLRHGTVWVGYALLLAGLVGAHLCLRVVRYLKRRARRAALSGRDPVPRR